MYIIPSRSILDYSDLRLLDPTVYLYSYKQLPET